MGKITYHTPFFVITGVGRITSEDGMVEGGGGEEAIHIILVRRGLTALDFKQ